MTLPADALHRWSLSDGGTVEVADLGSALLIAPAGPGGLRGMVKMAVDGAGGYSALVAKVAADDPDLT